jgi:hypothetical protein
MKRFFPFFIFILIAVSAFSQDGLTMVHRTKGKKAAFISEGTKISVLLTNGVKYKGYLGRRDSSGFDMQIHRRTMHVDYHQVIKVTAYKEMEYLSMMDWIFDDGDACGDDCSGCNSSDNIGYAVAAAALVLAAVIVVELTIEVMADAANDKHYNMTKEWFFVVN